MKICSLLPSGTEILFALGLDDEIAGVTDLCDYPPEAGGKPVVSRSLMDTSRLSSAEVNVKMQELLMAGKNPYELDIAWLHQEKPKSKISPDTPGPLASAYEVLEQTGKLEGFRFKNVLASYIHLHFGSKKSLASRFVESCVRWTNI